MTSVSIWRQHNVDTVLVDVSIHRIRRRFFYISKRKRFGSIA